MRTVRDFILYLLSCLIMALLGASYAAQNVRDEAVAHGCAHYDSQTHELIWGKKENNNEK